MKYLFISLILIFISNSNIMAQNSKTELTAAEKLVIIDKGTEAPFSGKYYNFKGEGTYVCNSVEILYINHQISSPLIVDGLVLMMR